MLRGDDVAELQQRLSAFGFDTGRVDGIFGDMTSAALGEFQRNAGVPVDGIAGAFDGRPRCSALGPATTTPSRLPRCGTGNGSARGRGPWPASGWPSARRGPRRHRGRAAETPGQLRGGGDHPSPSRRLHPGLGGQRRRRPRLHRPAPGRRRGPLLHRVLRRVPLLLTRGPATRRAPPGVPHHFARPSRRGSRACRSPSSERPACPR